VRVGRKKKRKERKKRKKVRNKKNNMANRLWEVCMNNVRFTTISQQILSDKLLLVLI